MHIFESAIVSKQVPTGTLVITIGYISQNFNSLKRGLNSKHGSQCDQVWRNFASLVKDFGKILPVYFVNLYNFEHLVFDFMNTRTHTY